MIALNVGDKIRGISSVAAVVDYTIHGIVGEVVTQIADGQLPSALGDLYTASDTVVISSLILVNTDTAARTVNLYLLPSGGNARRLIPKDLSLGIGYSLHFNGTKITVIDTEGKKLTTGGGGAGDMTKAIYDTDADDIVDKAETVDDGAGNSSTAADVKDAVTKKHTQNTDTDLDATFEATFVKKADAVNVLSDITSAGADIEDAVTEKHAANGDTDLDATFEATFEKVANKDAVSGYAGLNASQKVIKNPANATATPTASKILIADGDGRVNGWISRFIEYRLLDKDTDHTVATVGGEFRVPKAMTILDVGAYVDTAGVTGLATIDIHEAGTTILSTKITIDTTEKTSETAATPPVISDSAIAADAILTFDIDVIQTTPAKGLVVWMEVKF